MAPNGFTDKEQKSLDRDHILTAVMHLPVALPRSNSSSASSSRYEPPVVANPVRSSSDLAHTSFGCSNDRGSQTSGDRRTVLDGGLRLGGLSLAIGVSSRCNPRRASI